MSGKKFGFGLPQAEVFTAPKLEASGLEFWKHEVKPKDGDKIVFVPLHSTAECLQVWVHTKAVKYDGGFKYVPSGKRNTHLFPAVESPFDTDPNDEVRKTKLANYMLVYVVSGAGDLDGHVGYLELRFNYKKKNGTGDLIQTWENDQGEEITGRKVNLKRTGKGLTDTVYTASVGNPHTFSEVENATIDAEAEGVLAYLKSLFTEGWTPERFVEVYKSGIVNSTAPKQVETTPEVDETDIPF